MTRKIRFLILVICVALFFIAAPYIITYSLGYRIDFEQKKLVITGGIYVKALPQGADIIVDSKISNRTSLLSPTVFVQNLLPKQHSILIKKDGYHDYKKTLEVKEKEVIRLERVVLFKEKIPFEDLTDKTNSPFLKKDQEQIFIIKNGDLYKNSPEKSLAILKKIISFEVSGNNIIWLGLDGFLYSSNQDGNNTDKLSQTPLKVDNNSSYKIVIAAQNIFLLENNNFLLLNQKTKKFETFYSLVKNFKISPDGQKILYYNESEIMYSYLNSDNPEKIFLNRFSEKIEECFWLGDNYLIFNIGEKIIISEIDNRDNINMITLQQTLSPGDKIFFNQQDKKLYILTGNNILVSERLIP
ncbi:MAG: PEGA domain-containing protein [Candidatus Staskawiczbacteria bacterium]|nr:PEGA domain-containing protein [Candidatus Staskawiczbacteria bacterium]MBI3337551.1 PEGA domain-containing protein [Candidatus Staskawiczbacteria bacterium]